MVIGLKNRTTAQRESDLFITSMITDRIGRHEVLLPINHNSETQRLVQNVILKLEKIKMVLVKPTMVKHPLRTKLVKRCGVYARDTYMTFPL